MPGKRKKIAVVVTHGMGEQIPMETLRNFVEAAWVTNKDAHWPKTPSDENSADIWFTPDPAAGSLELRRITTRWTKAGQDGQGPRVDFFEFYWADLAEGTTVEEVYDWIQILLWRWPKQVPDGLMGIWLVLWGAAVSLLALSVLALWPWPHAWIHAAFAALAGLVGYGLKKFIAPYIGDVARYVRADPRNIAMRHAIRERGLKLLQDIHDTGFYDRVIMVSHSLGTIIAYDLVSLFWANRPDALVVAEDDETLFKKLRAVETAAHALAAATDANRTQLLHAYREAQQTLRLAMRSGGEDGNGRTRAPKEEWLISDLVTLGSPLTHAKFLLARDSGDLEEKIKRFLFPTNLPQFQLIQTEQRNKINLREPKPSDEIFGPKGGLFSYFLGPPKQPDDPKKWTLHHAAPFAAVRWTNIYDTHRPILRGDIISGPVAPVFGAGIHDINLKDLRGQSKHFSHTLYWALPSDGGPMPHIEALRKAINLQDKPDSELW
jgi:hypothetical protein